MITQIQLNRIRLGNQFVIHILDLPDDATMERLVFVPMVVATGGEGKARHGEDNSGEKMNRFHENSFC